MNNISLQDSILQQLQIVQKSKVFPIWVSKFIHINIFIGNKFVMLYKILSFYKFLLNIFQMI